MRFASLVLATCYLAAFAGSAHAFAQLARSSRTQNPTPAAVASKPTNVNNRHSFSPVSKRHSSSLFTTRPRDNVAETELHLTESERQSVFSLVATTPIMISLLASLPANAAEGGDFFPVASALAAYIHFAGLFCTVGCLAAERVIIGRENFGETDEDLLTKVDAAYGLFSIPVLVSGYLRVTQYGKGFDFYKHEPFFWVKIALAGVLASCSFFPTGVIIKRAVEKKDMGGYVPMPLALRKRMASVINAELSGILVIPLTASLMARGVGYDESFPWQAEAGLAALVFAGAAFKYIKEVFTFDENSMEESMMPPLE